MQPSATRACPLLPLWTARHRYVLTQRTAAATFREHCCATLRTHSFCNSANARSTDRQAAGGKVPLVFNKTADYRHWRNSLPDHERKIGFVPTMGALHDGHLSLARLACTMCKNVVVSIFVNPSQFAPHEDLSAYPRTVAEDLKMLRATGVVDAVIIPSIEEMYPSGISLVLEKQTGTFVEVLRLGSRLEGVVRPHFFRGVTTVVTKLLNVVQPSHLFLGQKDLQQASIVRHMLHDLLVPVELVVGATVREQSDGLAMSSRNRYLNPAEKAVAGTLYRALRAGRDVCFRNSGARCARGDIFGAAEKVIHEVIVKERAKGDEKGVPILLEYLSLVDPWTLEEVEYVGPFADLRNGHQLLGGSEPATVSIAPGPGMNAFLCGAIRIGKTRLIDNLTIGCKFSTNEETHDNYGSSK